MDKLDQHTHPEPRRESPMAIELVPHTGINLVTKKEQVFEQYSVFDVDGGSRQRIGLIGWAHGSPLILCVPIDPIRKKKIQAEIESLLERDAAVVQVADIPEEVLNPPPPEELSFDEFDESDLT